MKFHQASCYILLRLSSGSLIPQQHSFSNILVPGEDTGFEPPTYHSKNENIRKALTVYLVRRPHIREWEVVRNKL
jgi:hypothetical protein